MMDHSRTEILTGPEGLVKLKEATVIIAGLGGVGGYAAEAVARAGAGRIVLIDFDKVAPSNCNRQILALQSTLGRYKTDVARERITDINPDTEIIIINKRLLPENIAELIPDYDNSYAIDAIDEVPSKVALIHELVKRKTPFVSSMGAGSRLDPSGIVTADISKTSYCPLARTVRRKLKEIEIYKGVRCIYSQTPLPRKKTKDSTAENGERVQGSISYMPGIFGLTAAGVIIGDILG